MEVNIGELASTVRAIDGDSVLTPQTLDKIVRIVLQAVHDEKEHRDRVRAEQRISGGVREELEEGGR